MASINLQDLRRRIYLKAKSEPEWRFWGLFVHVCKMETLEEAYKLARRDSGAPGVDGVTFEQIEEQGGRPQKRRVLNMLGRLSEHRHEVLAFMEDFAVPFDSNQAARDIRMMKVKQKIFGVFSSDRGADIFCRIRNYISTARKNSVSAFSAITDALEGRAFIPQV